MDETKHAAIEIYIQCIGTCAFEVIYLQGNINL